MGSPFHHQSIIHLSINLLSFYMKGRTLEPKLGVIKYVKTVILSVIGTCIMHVILRSLTPHVYPELITDTCVSGLSATLFCLKVITIRHMSSVNFSLLFELLEMIMLAEKNTRLYHVSGLVTGLFLLMWFSDTCTIKGMKKCMNCPICPFVVEGKAIKATATNAVVELNAAVTCQTSNIIYCITCSRCQKQYVGQSERTLQARFSEHRDYAKKKDFSKACGAHFSSRGHSVHDMKVSILEKVHSNDELLRVERESMFIRDFNSKYKGLNRQT